MKTDVSGTGSRLVAGMGERSQFRWVACDLTDVVRAAQARLDMGPVASIAFGRCAAAASMLLWLTTKTPRRLTLDVRGSGPLRQVLVEVVVGGGVRGLVGEPHATGASGATDISIAEAIGIGLLRVRREDDAEAKDGKSGMTPNYESQVELATSEIGGDVAYYLEQSEQRQCAVAVGVDVGPRGIVSAAGLLVEALPGVCSEALTRLEADFPTIDPISKTLAQHGPLGVAQSLFSDVEVTTEQTLEYRCGCSADRLSSQLSAMPATEISALSDDDVIRAQCAYCATVYELSEAELLSQGAAAN